MSSTTNAPTVTLWIAMLSLLLAALLIGLCTGPANISLSNVAVALFPNWASPLSSDFKPWMETIVTEVRLPRMIIAALVGGTLALCGTVLQGLFRNPLASPSILGVSSGASLGAVIAIFLGLTAISAWILPLFAFFGAGITLLIVYSIANHGGHTQPSTLLLAGVAMSALNVALSSFILAMALQHWDVGKTIVYWSLGGIEGRTWSHVQLLAPVALLGGALLIGYHRDLDALLLGEMHATSVGVDIEKTHRIVLLLTALLTGAAVAVAGGIGFIGLIIPHIMRLLIGPHHRFLMPASVLAGALCLTTTDVILRIAFIDQAIPIGVITAAMGAPFFLFLLIQQRKTLRI